MIAGLVYSLPMLFEVRFSPQLHYWFYGYYPSDFIQGMRDGGFRPMVFMGHGLLAAFFTMTTWWLPRRCGDYVRSRGRVSLQRALRSIWPAYCFCAKRWGPLYTLWCWFPRAIRQPRLQVRVALLLVSLALAYPMLRSFDLVPTNAILDAASSISSQRAESLKFRLKTRTGCWNARRNALLFGWGRYGRSRVYAEWGQDMSTTDGRWIITLGTFGVFGFIAEFGLLSIGVFRAAMSLRFVQSNSERLCLGTFADCRHQHFRSVAQLGIDALDMAAVRRLAWQSGSIAGARLPERAPAQERPRAVGYDRISDSDRHWSQLRLRACLAIRSLTSK